MAETTYRVSQQVDGSYRVEFVEAGIVPRVTTGFKTEADALAWIEQDKRMAAASDRWEQQAPRNWRDD